MPVPWLTSAPSQMCWVYRRHSEANLPPDYRTAAFFYNGHKRVQALKCCVADGMIVNLHGPVEGRRHDAFLLTDSGLLPQLEANMDRPNPVPGSPAVYSLYGDPAYPLHAHLLRPHRGRNLPAAEQQFNSEMSAVRVAVELEFERILFLFPVVFGTILIYFFDEKKDGAAENSIVCFGASIPCHAI